MPRVGGRPAGSSEGNTPANSRSVSWRTSRAARSRSSGGSSEPSSSAAAAASIELAPSPCASLLSATAPPSSASLNPCASSVNTLTVPAGADCHSCSSSSVLITRSGRSAAARRACSALHSSPPRHSRSIARFCDCDSGFCVARCSAATCLRLLLDVLISPLLCAAPPARA